jgi:hypothetical protein
MNQDLISLQPITENTITDYVKTFFTITPEQTKVLLETDWNVYQFFSEAVTFEYKVLSNQYAITSHTKYSLPTGFDPTQQHEATIDENVLYFESCKNFMNIIKEHFHDVNIFMQSQHKYQPILVDKDISVEYDTKTKLLMIGQNKYMYAYDLKKTYIIHVTLHVPIKLYETFNINLQKFNFGKLKHMYQILKLTHECLEKLTDIDQLFIIKDPHNFSLLSIDKTLTDTVSIPYIYLSKTFIPKEVRLEDVNKVNKKAIKMLKKIEKIGSKLFQIFK